MSRHPARRIAPAPDSDPDAGPETRPEAGADASPDSGDGGDDRQGIRQMCATFGVTPRTLRFYEQKGLIAPERRGQHRLYGRRDRARLKLILRGRRFGFSLDEIGELLDLYDRDDRQLTQLRRTYDIGRQRLADMERQRAELDEAIVELRADLAWGAQVLGLPPDHGAAAETADPTPLPVRPRSEDTP